MRLYFVELGVTCFNLSLRVVSNALTTDCTLKDKAFAELEIVLSRHYVSFTKIRLELGKQVGSALVRPGYQRIIECSLDLVDLCFNVMKLVEA